MEKSIWGVKRSFPRQRVASQWKVLMAEGMAMTRVVAMKAVPKRGCMPLTNMWCPQTRKLRTAMAAMLSTMVL